MLEVNGEEKPLILTFQGNCWGDNSRISISYPIDRVTIYHTSPSGNKTIYSSDSEILKKNLGTFTVKANVVSTLWDDIYLMASGTPVSNAGSSSGHQHPSCLSNLLLTAYSITISVDEKPWGGGWGGVEDSGPAPNVGGSSSGSSGTVSQQWYHMWTVNENAIRANVAPQCLATIVTNTTFSGLSVSDFNPESDAPSINAQPKWKKITAGVGFCEEVKATITAGGKDLPGTQNKVDIMVNSIIQVEWLPVGNSHSRTASSSQQAANLAKLELHGGGYRTFSEKTEPNTFDASGNLLAESTNYNQVEAKVKLAAAIPKAGMWATVYADWFDPINPITNNWLATNGRGKRDNNGKFDGFANERELKFWPQQDTAFVICDISPAHAGDNYIIAVHPNRNVVGTYMIHDTPATPSSISYITRLGDPSHPPYIRILLESSMQTSSLTVWRTLWLELKQMKPPVLQLTGTSPPDPPGPYDFSFDTKYSGSLTKDDGNGNQVPIASLWDTQLVTDANGNEPDDFDLAVQPPLPDLTRTTEQFARACIDARAATDNQVKQWSGKTPPVTLTMPDFIRNLDWGNVSAIQVGRDVPATCNTNDFWILHALGAYDPAEYGVLDSGYSGYATPVSALIYNELTRDMISTYRFKNPLIWQGQGPQPNWFVLNGQPPWVSLSEALSLLMLHEALHYFLGTHEESIFLPPNFLSGLLPNRGIMNVNLQSHNFMYSSGTHTLDEEQIWKIQKQPKPAPDFNVQ